MKVLAILMVLVLIALQIALFYVVVPFILMQVLLLFGIKVGFWLCFGIMLVFYLLVSAVKRV